MRFNFTQDVDTVFNALTDQDLYVARCVALGEKAKCVTTTSGSTVKLAVERTVRRDLPGPLAKIGNPENTIKSDVTWNNPGPGQAKSGSYTASIIGAPMPITINSTFSVRPQGDGCVYELDVKVTVKHLLLGKIAQAFAQKEVEESVPKEIEETRRQLA